MAKINVSVDKSSFSGIFELAGLPSDMEKWYNLTVSTRLTDSLREAGDISDNHLIVFSDGKYQVFEPESGKIIKEYTHDEYEHIILGEGFLPFAAIKDENIIPETIEMMMLSWVNTCKDIENINKKHPHFRYRLASGDDESLVFPVNIIFNDSNPLNASVTMDFCVEFKPHGIVECKPFQGSTLWNIIQIFESNPTAIVATHFITSGMSASEYLMRYLIMKESIIGGLEGLAKLVGIQHTVHNKTNVPRKSTTVADAIKAVLTAPYDREAYKRDVKAIFEDNPENFFYYTMEKGIPHVFDHQGELLASIPWYNNHIVDRPIRDYISEILGRRGSDIILNEEQFTDVLGLAPKKENRAKDNSVSLPKL